MTDHYGAFKPSQARTEFFSKHPISVFPSSNVVLDGEQPQQQSVRNTSVDFARQIAGFQSVQSFSDPFYVMDMGRVTELISLWKKSLPRVFPFYSVNCNDDMVLLNLLANYGEMGFFCQSRQNTEKALQFVGSDRILYLNPMWTRSSLSQAMEYGVNLLCFESARDLDRILMNHPNAEILLHICINGQSDDTSAQMGCNLNDASTLLQLAADHGANCVGISFTIGSGCEQPSIYASAIDTAARLFDFGRQLGLNMNILNLGGGFSHGQNNFPKICEYINSTLDYCFPIEDCRSKVRIIATPGRFFAGSPFSLVTNIIGRRSVDLSNITNDDFDSGNEAFIYQTNESYYGPFACRLNAIEPECRPLFDHYLDNFNSEHVYGSIMGTTFNDMDIVQQLCRFRALNEGDWLIWQDMGAYSMNNKATLDDVDEYPQQHHSSFPVIFYFASQKAWDHIEVSSTKNEEDLSSCDGGGSFPSSPVHSMCCDEDDRESLNSCRSNSPELDDDDDDPENFLSMFVWPIQ